MDLGDGAGLDAVGMVDEELRVDAELLVEDGWRHTRNALEVLDPVLEQAVCDAGADVPDVCDGTVVPDGAAEGLLVQKADAVFHVLGRNVERQLAQEEVGADARSGRDVRLCEDLVHQHARDLARRLAVELEVGGGVDEALVDGVDVDVLRCDEAQVDAVDLGADLHVVAHARLDDQVVDAGRYLEEAAAVAYAQLLHGGGDGQTDGLLRALWVCHHQVGGEGVQAPLGALDAGVEGLEVDADVCAARVSSHGVSIPHGCDTGRRLSRRGGA